MNGILCETEKGRPLDEATKKQIKTLIYIMREIDETGRTLMMNTGQTLKARSDLDRARKEKTDLRTT